MLGTLVQCDRCESAAGGVIPEARLGKSMELSSLRTASGGLTLQKIKFCDDENAILAEMEKHNRAGKLEGQ